jgi:hypothetical protein
MPASPAWVIALGLAAFVSCKPAAVKPGEPAPGANASVASPAGGGGGQDEVPASIPGEPECAAGGRVWDGKPQGCAYEHGKCCYDAAEPACAAAGCAAGTCVVMESYPAQVRCNG